MSEMPKIAFHKFRKSLYFIFAFSSLILLLSQQSCKKDEECTAPQLDSITFEYDSVSIDYLIPTRRVTLHGLHLEDVTRIKINNLSYDASYLYHPDTTISFTVPYVDANVSVSDTITVFKSCGSDHLEVTVMMAPALIRKISNEKAVAGEVITLKGKYFKNLTEVIFPDSIFGEIVPGYNDSVCQVIVPPGIMTHDKIYLVSLSGKSNSSYNIEFNDSLGMICDFDEINTQLSTGGITSSDADVPPARGNYFVTELMDVAPGSGENANSELTHEILEMPVYNGNLTPDYFGIQAEMFLKYPWKTGYYKILIGFMNETDELDYAYEYKFQPWSDSVAYAGIFRTHGWETITIPLTKFKLVGSNSIYLQSYSQLRLINYVNWVFINPEVEDGGKPLSQFKMAMDNFRIVQIKSE